MLRTCIRVRWRFRFRRGGLRRSGRSAALRLCLDRIARPRRDAPVSIELPPVRSAADAAKASASVLASVANGEVTPDEAGRIMALLASHKSIVAASDLEQRIAALEEAAR